MIEWFENLPEQCPPKEAFNPDGYTFYRLSTLDRPDNNDFVSHRFLYPNRVFQNVSDCISRSLSVYNDIDKCNNLRKLPRHKDKKAIMALKLIESDGLVMKTFNDVNHYSWWRSKSFNFAIVKVIK